MRFDSLGLSASIIDAVKQHGYKTPSPIQSKAIPAIIEGRDVLAAAQTGTGKTAGFTLPVLELLSRGQRTRANHSRALILTPTRELAAQINESIITYGKNLPLNSTAVFGGVKINPQMMRLRKGADILVATPGRLLDLHNQNAIKFAQLEILVLDEADRMLDMGFIHDIKKILAILPKKRQNLLFSATFSNDIRKLAKKLLNRPVEISVTPRNSTASSVKQWVYPVDKKQKPALLTQLIKDGNWQQVLVFNRTKHGANRLCRYLQEKGISAAAIHGNKSQGARTKALFDFKNGETAILVATDIAARGLDIDQLPQVINFDLPNVAEGYVHRIGRTGRAGASGHAISLVSADEFPQLSNIERLIKQVLPRKLIDGFEPVHDLPKSTLDTRPFKSKKNRKPKKPKAGHKDGQHPPHKPKQNGAQNKKSTASSGGKSAQKPTRRNKSTRRSNPKTSKTPR